MSCEMTSADIEELRFVDAADVYKGSTRAAKLTRSDSGGIAFSYLADYTGEDISFSLPRGSRVETTGGALPPFFAGLLPEGHRLNVLNRALKTSMDDEFSMLLAVGGDVPGDVRIFPEGQDPSEPEPVASSVSEWDFSEIVSAVDRVAIPGVQLKASSSMINAPIRTRDAAAILKVDPDQYPFLVRNEYLHLQGAKRLRIGVAQAAIVHDTHGKEGLLVKRFDRGIIDGQVSRLAQEDASQIMQITPAQKYSVDSESLVMAVASHASAPVVAKRNMYLQFLFAWLTGNGDLHAKNISLLRNFNGTWHVAPMYDLPCTALYRDFTMALPIAGRTKSLRFRHWQEFADTIGLPERAAHEAQKLALTAAQAIDLSAFPFEGSPLRGALRELNSRRHELAMRL
ncbi:type II toxin-antitoxin system HipA family toxin [Trueperella pyogenes]|uniref:type II toxin-antitoxin system HipA family toxin n=2 Tax=Trueperella pyogenes TaxID=1661 RepID=UPI001F2417F5|nr:HipA domain-containing protein [Trueperella pyogenes]